MKYKQIKWWWWLKCWWHCVNRRCYKMEAFLRFSRSIESMTTWKTTCILLVSVAVVKCGYITLHGLVLCIWNKFCINLAALSTSLSAPVKTKQHNMWYLVLDMLKTKVHNKDKSDLVGKKLQKSVWDGGVQKGPNRIQGQGPVGDPVDIWKLKDIRKSCSPRWYATLADNLPPVVCHIQPVLE